MAYRRRASSSRRRPASAGRRRASGSTRGRRSVRRASAGRASARARGRSGSRAVKVQIELVQPGIGRPTAEQLFAPKPAAPPRKAQF